MTLQDEIRAAQVRAGEDVVLRDLRAKERPGVPVDATHQHYKGGYYQLIGPAIHTETGENMMVYQSCEDSKLWVRPAAMFNEFVAWPDGVIRHRFQSLEPTS